MDSAFWIERWEQRQIGFHQDTVNTHLESFWHRLGLEPGSAVFVPLAGKTLDMLWLRGMGHSVAAVELSPIAVEEFFAENRLEEEVTAEGAFQTHYCDGVKILRGDFFQLRPEQLGRVDAVYDRAALVALPPPMRKAYAEHLKSLLPRHAQILLVTMEYTQHEMDGPPFSVGSEEVRALYADAYEIECIHTHDALAENPQFEKRGVTRLQERAYLLRPLPTHSKT